MTVVQSHSENCSSYLYSAIREALRDSSRTSTVAKLPARRTKRLQMLLRREIALRQLKREGSAKAIRPTAFGNLLCGSRAELFVGIFSLKCRELILSGTWSVAHVFLVGPAPFRFPHDSDHPDTKRRDWRQSLEAVEDGVLGTHAVVEVEAWDRIVTVDPTVNAIYESPVRVLRNQQISPNSDVTTEHPCLINPADVHAELELQSAPFRLYYASTFFWRSVVRQSYVQRFDSLMHLPFRELG